MYMYIYIYILTGEYILVFTYSNKCFLTGEIDKCIFKKIIQIYLGGLKPAAVDGKCLVYGVYLAGNVCACLEKWFYDRFTFTLEYWPQCRI